MHISLMNRAMRWQLGFPACGVNIQLHVPAFNALPLTNCIRSTTQLGEATIPQKREGLRPLQADQSVPGRSDQPGSPASDVGSMGWEQRERLRKKRPGRYTSSRRWPIGLMRM
jgi:hypothetical protein